MGVGVGVCGGASCLTETVKNRWHLDETYALVRAAFGSNQEHFVRDSTQSLLDRQAFARYHYQEALRLSKAFEQSYLQNCSLIHIYTLEAQQKRVAFEKYIIKAAAHATAAVQSLHAIPDILAHVTYFACAQNLGERALKEKAIALPTVLGTLQHEQKFRALVALLAKVQSGDLWQHLAALSNSSKHRSVIRTALSEDWTGARKNLRELQFLSFERDGKSYAALSLQELLEPEYNRLSRIIISLGQELNTCLKQ